MIRNIRTFLNSFFLRFSSLPSSSFLACSCLNFLRFLPHFSHMISLFLFNKLKSKMLKGPALYIAICCLPEICI